MARTLMMALLLLVTTAGASPAAGRDMGLTEQQLMERYQYLVDKDRIVETINQLFIGTDQRDWNKVKSLFAPEVRFDMTSLAGGTPRVMTPQQIVDGWDKGLKPLKAIHHQSGNFIVTVAGDQADAFCYGTATHYLPTKSGRNVRTFVGSYDFHLVRNDGVWWIDALKFNLKYIDGNKDLEKDK